MKPTLDEQKLRQLRDFLGALPTEYQPKFIHAEDLTAAAESLRLHKELVEAVDEYMRELDNPMKTDSVLNKMYDILTKIKQSAQ